MCRMDYKNKKKRAGAKNEMQSYLEALQCGGTELFVDGEAVLPGEAVRRTVQEACVYMADYVLGQDGHIEQIRFDRIELQ